MGGIESLNKMQAPPTQEIKKEETLDQILQSKIADQDILNKLKPILEDIQKKFSQSINEYIKTLDELELSLLADANDNDKKKMIETIDLFLNKNKTPEIVNTIEESIDINKEKTDINKENKEVKEKWFDLLESRKATKASYDSLDKSKYPEPTTEEIKEQKTNILPQTQKQIEEKWLNVEDYTKFLVIEKKYEKQLRKEKNTEFLDNLKELKQGLWETTTMAETTNRRHTDLIVTNNPSLNAYTKESPRLNTLTIPKAPEFKDFEKEFSLYVKLIPDEDTRKNIEKNKDIIKDFKTIYDIDPEDARDSEGQKAYEEYKDAINKVKETLPQKTQEIAKQRVLWSCITGLARYFDTTNIDPTGTGTNKENFANDFTLNTQSGFHIDKGTDQNEKDDDILYINGNIKGNGIGFYYNLTNPDAQLQSDDFLHFNTEAETFAFGVKWWGKNKLGIKLPTITTLSNEAQMVIDKDFGTELEKAKDMDEFESSFKDKISAQLLKNYGQEALVKTRVERDIEKNITTQTLQNMFFPGAVLTKLNTDKMTDKTTEKKSWKIMDIWDKSTENMRSDELRTFRWLLDRLDPLIAKGSHPNLEPKWQKLLGEIQKERTAVSYSQDRGKYILKFFRKFSKDNKIHIQDIEIFINGLEKEEDIWENIQKFSPEFQTAYEKDDADGLLENIG